MKKYYDNLNTEIKKYFKVLESNFPEWLKIYKHKGIVITTIY